MYTPRRGGPNGCADERSTVLDFLVLFDQAKRTKRGRRPDQKLSISRFFLLGSNLYDGIPKRVLHDKKAKYFFYQPKFYTDKRSIQFSNKKSKTIRLFFVTCDQNPIHHDLQTYFHSIALSLLFPHVCANLSACCFYRSKKNRKDRSNFPDYRSAI